MKLYELPCNTLFRVVESEDPQTPPDSNDLIHYDQIFKLYNIDGMYSYCVDIMDSLVYHFAAWTEVEPV